MYSQPIILRDAKSRRPRNRLLLPETSVFLEASAAD